jgi:hypothetical protein
VIVETNANYSKKKKKKPFVFKNHAKQIKNKLDGK